MAELYPYESSQRNQWILQRRGPKNRLEVTKPYAFLWEEECGANGELISTATIFLTNRECPYRCLMCDLWRNTLDERVPRGAIAGQIRHAVNQLPEASQIKLYNAGSFFDSQAIPLEDYAEIAETISGYKRVIVESHPALLNDRTGAPCRLFRDSIEGKLEVAIGLETVHPTVLNQLNKQMTVDDFRRAALFLKHQDMDLRVFLLLRPPFLSELDGLEWTLRSLDVAAEAGAIACSIIPTRGGNGAMEELGQEYHPPNLRSLEAAAEYGLSLNCFRVYSDLWDIEKFYDCECSERRASRLANMNRTQKSPSPVQCTLCHV